MKRPFAPSWWTTSAVAAGAVELRERVCRVLVGVAAERGQRLELADGLDPVAEMRTAALAPGLDREAELRAPQQQRAERCEELIAARIGQLDEADEPGDLP